MAGQTVKTFAAVVVGTLFLTLRVRQVAKLEVRDVK